MPLDKSGSKQSVGRNIRAEENADKPRRQAVAIALSVEDREKALHAREWRKVKVESNR